MAFLFFKELSHPKIGLSMEQRDLKNLNNCLKTTFTLAKETSGGQSSNPYLNVHFFNTSVN